MPNEPIRVLHVIGAMNIAGAETMLMNLYRNIDKSKVQFDFMVHTQDKADYDDEIKSLGGRIFNVPRFTLKNIPDYKKQWHNFFRNHPEIKIVHGHIGSSAAVYLGIAKKYGCCTIAHSHNTASDRVAYNLVSYPTRYIAHWLFACSELAGVRRFGKKMWQKKNGTVIKNAIDINRFLFDSSKREHLRSNHNWQDKFVVGHIGRFCTQKNHEFVIDVFYELQKINPESVLVLFGRGELEDKIRQKAKQLGIEQSICFMGLSTQIPEYMMAMDVLLFPSLFEGLPVTIVEAQSTGLPCVVSDTITDEVKISNLVEFVCLRKSAQYWAQTLISKQRIYQNMGETIKEHGYSISDSAKNIEDFYLNINNNED